jgi:hypothetical protein
MEQERLVVLDQVLVETEPAGQFRHGCADAIDPLVDLIDPGAGLGIGNRHWV